MVEIKCEVCQETHKLHKMHKDYEDAEKGKKVSYICPKCCQKIKGNARATQKHH